MTPSGGLSTKRLGRYCFIHARLEHLYTQQVAVFGSVDLDHAWERDCLRLDPLSIPGIRREFPTGLVNGLPRDMQGDPVEPDFARQLGPIRLPDRYHVVSLPGIRDVAQERYLLIFERRVDQKRFSNVLGPHVLRTFFRRFRQFVPADQESFLRGKVDLEFRTVGSHVEHGRTHDGELRFDSDESGFPDQNGSAGLREFLDLLPVFGDNGKLQPHARSRGFDVIQISKPGGQFLQGGRLDNSRSDRGCARAHQASRVRSGNRQNRNESRCRKTRRDPSHGMGQH